MSETDRNDMTVPTAPTGIGQYVRPERQQGDRKKANDMVNRPMLLWAREIKFLKKTRYNADGGDAVFVDFVDLQTNEVFIQVMWMAGAIVDGLRPFVGDGQAYPTMIKRVEGGDYEGYNVIEPIEDAAWLAHIQTNFATFHALVTQTRAAKEAEWAQAMGKPNQPAAAPAAPAANLTPAAPAAPSAPPAAPAAPVAPPAAVIPPAAPAAPAAPPAPPAPVTPPQAAAPAAPTPPVALPAPPGTVTGPSIAELQAKLEAAG